MATVSAVPGRLNLRVYREDDFELVIHFVDDNGTALDLTGYAFTAEARDTSGTLLATFTDTLTDATAGELTLSLSRTDTETLPNSCRWDLQVVDTDSKHHTWLAGVLTATGDVTDL